MRDQGIFSAIRWAPAALVPVLALTLAVACAPVKPLTTLAAESTGRIHFQSLSLTAIQFADGTKDASPVAISGELALPSGATRVPAMILLHGSAGVTATETGWARELVGAGVATFLLDSYSGRGISGWPSETQLSRVGGVIDAYRALELLATHPRIDRQRIGLMGFSRGGGLTVLAALDRFRQVWLPPDVDFAVYLPFYPNYRNAYASDDRVSRRPIRVFHGTADDANPISASREYVERLRRAGADARLFEYPGAHHSFDNPDFRGAVRARVPGGGAFTVAYNGRSHAQAGRDVRATLSASLRLGP